MNQENKNNDEISLIDIAKTLVLRRWWFVGIALSFFFVTVFLTNKQRTVQPIKMVRYTSFYLVGYMALSYTLEPLSSIEIEIREIYSQKGNAKLPVEVEQDLPKMGNLIKIHTSIPMSENMDDITKEIQEFHSSILNLLLTRHEKLLNSIREENKQNKLAPGSYSISTPSSILSLAQKSEFEQPVSKYTPSKIFTIGTLISFVFGFIGVFFLEFFLRVRKALNEDV